MMKSSKAGLSMFTVNKFDPQTRQNDRRTVVPASVAVSRYDETVFSPLTRLNRYHLLSSTTGIFHGMGYFDEGRED